MEYEYERHTGWTHCGYLDGIHGRDPNPKMEGTPEYDRGWLQGQEDHGDAEKLAILKPPTLKRGDRVVISKGTRVYSTKSGWRELGRTITVTLHDVYNPVQAHFDADGGFVPPKPAEVLWAGSGGYWQRASVRDVQLKEGADVQGGGVDLVRTR